VDKSNPDDLSSTLVSTSGSSAGADFSSRTPDGSRTDSSLIKRNYLVDLQIEEVRRLRGASRKTKLAPLPPDVQPLEWPNDEDARPGPATTIASSSSSLV
jgi:hypothetical protein